MSLLYLALSVAAAIAFYLGSRHQSLRVVAHPGRLRTAGWLLLALAWVAAWRALGVWGGGFAMLTAFMLAAVALPYFNAWLVRRKDGEARHVGKSLAAALLGLPLTAAVIGLVTLSWPGRSQVITLPWLLMSFPLWIGVMSAAFAARSGRRAWAWLGGLTLLGYALLHGLKLLGWIQVVA